MRSHLSLLAVIGLVLTAVESKAEEDKKDAEKLQGIWAAISYVRDGEGEGEKAIPAEDSFIRWVFKGESVTLLGDGEEAAKGTMKLDPTTTPKTLDINFPPAAGEKKGQTLLGIYELDGDTLKLCYVVDGVKRPAGFNSKAGSKTMLIVFKKLKT